MLVHICGVSVVGLIDMVMFGVLQGNAKSHWIRIVIVGIGYFVLYYFLFGFMIKKFNYNPPPGREDDDKETKLHTRADVTWCAYGGNCCQTPLFTAFQAKIILLSNYGYTFNALNKQPAGKLLYCGNINIFYFRDSFLP